MKNKNEIKSRLSKWFDSSIKTNKLLNIFDTQKLNLNEIEMFFKDKENEEFIHAFCKKIEYLCDVNLREYIKMIDADESFYRLLIKCICSNALLEYNIEQSIDINSYNLAENSFDETYEYFNRKKGFDNLKANKVFFRGQSDFEWGLIPSFFRRYIFTTALDGEVVDLEKLYEKYNNSGLIEKYNDTIAENKIQFYNDLDYGFISYMQHSVSYSPLIDITSKIEIATQFALGNKSDINSYLGSHSAVFAFQKNNIFNSDDEDEINGLLKRKFKVIILRKKIEPGKIMMVETSNDKIEELDCKTIPKIIKNLTPKFIIIEQIKNDRMKYQHGKFILFYDYILVNDSIPFYLNKDLIVTKLRIMRKNKKGLYKKINDQWPQYNMDYLMNPYDYFCK